MSSELHDAPADPGPKPGDFIQPPTLNSADVAKHPDNYNPTPKDIDVLIIGGDGGMNSDSHFVVANTES